MSFTEGLRHFKERPVHVACPVCAYRANQKAGKLRKNAILDVLPADCCSGHQNAGASAAEQFLQLN